MGASYRWRITLLGVNYFPIFLAPLTTRFVVCCLLLLFRFLLQISLNHISTCSIEKLKFKNRFPCLGCIHGGVGEGTLNMVVLNVIGERVPKVWIGLKDPKQFTRIIMALKNTPNAASATAHVA